MGYLDFQGLSKFNVHFRSFVQFLAHFHSLDDSFKLSMGVKPETIQVVMHHGSYGLLCLLSSAIACLVGLGALWKLRQTAESLRLT